MTFRFDPNDSFVAVEAELVGPMATDRVILALDTGATETTIDQNVMTFLGFDPSQPIAQFSVTTANGQVVVKEFRLDSLTALGVEVKPMNVIAMDLQGRGYEGLLGMDFFRDRALKIDFRNGTIELQ
jgi:predicted aspartyl protease